MTPDPYDLALARLERAIDAADALYSLKAVDDGLRGERDKVERWGVKSILSALKAQFDAVLSGDLSSIAQAVSRLGQGTPGLRTAIVNTLTRGATLGVKRGVEQVATLGVDLDASAVNKDALKWARSYGYDLVKDIDATSRDALRLHVGDWIESGKPLDALTERLAPHFGESRAEMIGVTEATRSYAMGQLTAYDRAVISKKKWVAEGGACPICQSLDGETVALDEDFDDGISSPPAHPSCRCSIEPVTD